MKSLFLCSSLGGGGAERVAVNLANSMVNLGHSVTIFSRRKSTDCYTLDAKVRIFFPEKQGLINGVLALKKTIASGNYDAVISFTDVPNIVNYIASNLCKNRPLFIPTIHTNLVARDARLKQDLRFRTIRFLHKLACRSADKVVVVSEGSRDSLLTYYELPDFQAETIYNPVITDEEAISSSQLPKRKKQVRLIAAGRLTDAKNYYMMIDVVKKLNETQDREFSLDIFGKGELSHDLQSYVVQRRMQNQIFFKGFVDDLKSQLTDYDIFLFTSDWEGFGNVLVEALCAGISVVSTDCPSGPSEILGGGRFGRLVDVGDVDGCAQAVEEELEHPLEFDTQALVHHLINFREGVVVNKYVDLIYDAQSTKVQN